MATNLLLEGDDLEALLQRAAAEGGANARILRAEKVRHGGFLGFFAREHFEVAVEIPDAVQVQDPDGAAAAGVVGAPATRRGSAPAAGPPGRRPAPAAPVRGFDEADDAQVAALVAALAEDRAPEPGLLAAEGLLGLADRVSAAERAAVGADDSIDVRGVGPDALAGARTRSAFDRHLPQTSRGVPAEPGAAGAGGWWAGVPTPAHGIAALSAANGINGVVPWTDPAAAAAVRAVDEHLAADRERAERERAAREQAVREQVEQEQVALARAEQERAAREQAAQEQAAQERAAQEQAAQEQAAREQAERALAQEQAAAEAIIRAALQARRGAVRHEPPAAPAARPSTSTPEFTALLDTLRSGVRPAPASAAPAAPPPAPRPEPGVAPQPPMPQQRSAGTGSSRVQVTVQATGSGVLGGPAVEATPEPAPIALQHRVEPAPPAEPAEPAESADHVVTDPVIASPAVAPSTAPATTAPATTAPATTAPATTAPAPQRTPVPPFAAAAVRSVQASRGLLSALGADDDEPGEAGAADRDGATERQVNADRRALRRLGVPTPWTRRYQGPDRFSGVLRMLDRLPTLDIDPDTRIVAIIGPTHLVTLEAHRTALDLAADDQPRPVVIVPSRPGQARRAAIARAQRLPAGVVAVGTEDSPDDSTEDRSTHDIEGLLDTLQAIGAGAVVAVVDARRGLGPTRAWLAALDGVDALVVEGAATVSDPAAVLQLDLPVVRLDGIPVDQVTWSALLCARMLTSLGLDPVQAHRSDPPDDDRQDRQNDQPAADPVHQNDHQIDH